MALSNPCKVCTALDTMPDEDADALDEDLGSRTVGYKTITRRLNESGHPVTRSSVQRHVQGKCSLGIDYRKVSA